MPPDSGPGPGSEPEPGEPSSSRRLRSLDVSLLRPSYVDSPVPRHPSPLPSMERVQNLKVISSKYDFIKVRVYLDRKHYYVLSRFLISRFLMAIQVDYEDAVRIALELKKCLVDQSTLDLPQASMEPVLFQLLRQHGYGEDTLHCYRLLWTCHHHRIPMVILIHTLEDGAGPMDGLAIKLAERLHLPSILRTGLVRQVLGPHYPAISIRTALQVDLKKAILDGKSLILIGKEVDGGVMDDIHRYEEMAGRPGLVVPFSCVQGADPRFSPIYPPSPDPDATLASIHRTVLQRLALHPSMASL